MNTDLMFSTGKDDWQTPPELFKRLDEEFSFDVDAAATKENTLCDMWFTDALSSAWFHGYSYFVNPPYSRGLQGKFIAKAAEESAKGALVVMLLPARTDTKAFHAYIWDAENHRPKPGVEVRFLRGRLKFVGAKASAPFPSMVVVFRRPTE